MSRKKHLIILIIFILYCVFSIRSFLGFDVTIGHNWDNLISPMEINHQQELSTLPYAWNTLVSFGQISIISFSNLPWRFINSLLGILMNGIFITQLKVIVPLTVGAFFLYLFLFNTFRNYSKENYKIIIPAFLGGIFLISSPVVLGHLIGGANNQLETMMLLPILLYTLQQASKNKFENKYICVLSIIFFFLSISWHNMIFGTLFTFFYIIFLYNNNIKKKISIFLKLTVIIALLYIYWIVPFIANLNQENVEKRIAENITYDTIKIAVPNITSAFFTNGYVRPFYDYLVSTRVVMIWKAVGLFLFLLVIIFSFLYSTKIKRFAVFWASIFIFTLVFATGAKEPFGKFVLWLYENCNFMALFRSPQWFMMPLTISFSVLIGITFFQILIKYSSYKKNIYLLIIFFQIIIILFIVHPFFISGDLGTQQLYQQKLDDSHWYNADHLDNFKVPADYKNAIEYLKNDNSLNRSFLLPITINPYYKATSYQREGAGLDPILSCAPPKPFIFSVLYSNDYVKNLINELEKRLYMDYDFSAFYSGRIFNSKYILLKKDYSPVFSERRTSWNAEKMYESIIAQKNKLGDIIVDGESTLLLKLKHEYYNDRIYIPDKIYYSDYDNLDQRLVTTIFDEVIDNRSIAFINKKYNQQLKSKPSITSTLTAKQISPVEYRVNIENSPANFLLVFSEAYYPSWSLLYNSEKVPFEHIYANGYANAWIIKKDQLLEKKLGNNIEFTIYFTPQKLFNKALLVSMITLIGIFIFIVYIAIKSKLNGKIHKNQSNYK